LYTYIYSNRDIHVVFFTNEDDLTPQQLGYSNDKTPSDSKAGLSPFELIE